VGLQGNRNQFDELLLKYIMEAAMLKRDSEHKPQISRYVMEQLVGSKEPKDFMVMDGCLLKIMDMRPRASAMANRTGGYGYENTAYYPGTTLQFCNIGNIHAVRDSYQKLSNLCLSTTVSDTQWMSLVEDTKWLSHLRLILAASWEAAFWTHVHRLPVLLHCSHGWDRTSQVAALAQLLLDPHYRTMKGFATLVEKDFMSFGHPFHTRCSHGEGRGSDTTIASSSTGTADEGQISPIFIQFLDAVYQVVHQYPESFEFNTRYLLVMSEYVYSARFGTLLCDTEREREMVAAIRQRTHSLWDYLEERQDTRNRFYTPGGILLMPLPSLLRNVTLWADRHCMYGPKATLRGLDDPQLMKPVDPSKARDQQGAFRCESDYFDAMVAKCASEKMEVKSTTEAATNFTSTPTNALIGSTPNVAIVAEESRADTDPVEKQPATEVAAN
jgi:myotubularin-related protein 1/2